MTEQGRWIETCSCGRETYVENAAFVTVTPPSAEPCDFEHPSYGSAPTVVSEAGWCGCGQPERIDAMMLAYLGSGNEHGILHAETDAELLIAYLAAELEYTDHGGSILGAWLSDDGRAALANLRARDTH